MLEPDDIGGARVRRTFTRGAQIMRRGDTLNAEDICSMGANNRRALINAGYIEVWPKSPIQSIGSGSGSRHIVYLCRGQYDVIEGRKLNEKPLSKEDAEELATRPDSAH